MSSMKVWNLASRSGLQCCLAFVTKHTEAVHWSKPTRSLACDWALPPPRPQLLSWTSGDQHLDVPHTQWEASSTVSGICMAGNKYLLKCINSLMIYWEESQRGMDKWLQTISALKLAMWEDVAFSLRNRNNMSNRTSFHFIWLTLEYSPHVKHNTN